MRITKSGWQGRRAAAQIPGCERAAEVVKCASFDGIHTELWTSTILAPKPQHLLGVSQLSPLSVSFGNLLALPLKLDSMLSQKNGRGREKGRDE